MNRFFQPIILVTLLLVVVIGQLIPSISKKPRFFVQKTEVETEFARAVFVKKLSNSPLSDYRIDWFELTSSEIITQFLPDKLEPILYSSSDVLEIQSIFVKSVPTDLEKLPSGEKKAIFVRFMLPLILKSNEEIWKQRQTLYMAQKKDDFETIKRIAGKYAINTDEKDMDEIITLAKHRVLPVPTSLALAQAAIESGWGTSRFSMEGNALFGQWAWSAEAGIKPLDASNNRAVIRRFSNLQGSVKSYMKNLNTHNAYEDFRKLRWSYIEKEKWPNGIDLAPSMHPYAEIGEHYIAVIKDLILQNQLLRFDYSQLVN